MYIEPCCIDKELPEILKKQPFCFFQSNGDWTTASLMKAVSHLVPHSVALLSIPEVDVFLLRTLKTYLSQGWYRGLVLVTAEPQAELVKSEMGRMLPLVTYANNSQVQDGMLALTDFSKFLVVQGAMLLEKDFSLCLYAGFFGSSSKMFSDAIESVATRAKMGAFIRSESEEIKCLLQKEYVQK